FIKGQIVDRSTETLVRKEGDSLSLNCTYSTGNPTIMWYLQDNRKSLIFILHDQSDPEDTELRFRNRVSGVVSRSNKSFVLTITDLKPDDAGIYYCVFKHPMMQKPHTGVQ
ncbi:hypothetical protein GDO86_001631, partial [Hymenochirus boettgeri]